MAAAAAPLRVAIVGGSIGGLAAATALHRLGAKVRVFEKSPEVLSKRGGSLGFCDVSLWEFVRGERMIRRGQRANRGQGAFWYGDLWSFWYAGLPAGTVTFGATIDDLGDPEHPSVMGESFDMAIIADGGWSALRAKYFGPAMPIYAGYQVFRFRIDAAAVPFFRGEGEYQNGFYYTILLRVAADDGRDFIMGGSTAPADESEIARPALGANRQSPEDADASSDPKASHPEWFLPLYREKFGQAGGGGPLRVMETAAAKGKITALPQYEFAAQRVVHKRLVLVGDAAHMASPRTASGAHTAVLDAAGILQAFAEISKGSRGGEWGPLVDRALAAYEPGGLQRAFALYRRSREVSEPCVKPGWTPVAECVPLE